MRNELTDVLIENKIVLDKKPNIKLLYGLCEYYLNFYIPYDERKQYSINYKRLDTIKKYERNEFKIKVRDSELYLINRALQFNGYKHTLKSKNE